MFDNILNTDAMVNLKNEIYLTQMSMLRKCTPVVHIKDIFSCKFVTA